MALNLILGTVDASEIRQKTPVEMEKILFFFKLSHVFNQFHRYSQLITAGDFPSQETPLHPDLPSPRLSFIQSLHCRLPVLTELLHQLLGEAAGSYRRWKDSQNSKKTTKTNQNKLGFWKQKTQNLTYIASNHKFHRPETLGGSSFKWKKKTSPLWMQSIQDHLRFPKPNLEDRNHGPQVLCALCFFWSFCHLGANYNNIKLNFREKKHTKLIFWVWGMWFPSLQFAQILRSIPLSGTWGSQKNYDPESFPSGHHQYRY